MKSSFKLLENNLKGTKSGISSDPPYKDGNARFTKTPLKSESLSSINQISYNV